MTLRREVLHRILLAKSILFPGLNTPPGEPNPFLIAKLILNAHDAADLVFAGIADQKRKLSAKSKSPSMLECLELIGTQGKKYAGYFKQLNDARNSLKHVGNLPNTNQWARVGTDVFEKLSTLCRETLGKNLTDLDEIELLENADVQTHLLNAKRLRDADQFQFALAEVGKALHFALLTRIDLWEIRVGHAKAEDALKLTAFGIPANDFLRLQEFLPRISQAAPDAPFEAAWKQSRYGHPANWRIDVVDFCIDTCLEVALGIQGASPVPDAIEFDFVYRYRVTAKKDHVEVWEDLIDDHLEDAYANGPRPFRTLKRYLSGGESISVSPFTKPLVTDDLSLAGEAIKRVRVSYTGFSAIFAQGRAEFVNLDDVEITCVPQRNDMLHERYHNLPEMPWQDDPND